MSIKAAIKNSFSDKYGNKDLSTTSFASAISAAGLAAMYMAKKNRIFGILAIAATTISSASALADMGIRTGNFIKDDPNKVSKKPSNKKVEDEVIDLDFDEIADSLTDRLNEMGEKLEAKSEEIKESAKKAIDDIINHEVTPEDVAVKQGLPEETVDALKESFEKVVPPKKDAEKEAAKRTTKKTPTKKAEPKKAENKEDVKKETPKKAPAKSSTKKAPAKPKKEIVVTG